MSGLKTRSLREYAVAEVRGAKNPLRAAQFVFEALLQTAAEGRVEALGARADERRAALQLEPGDGVTASGDPVEILRAGPRSLEELAVINCFFAVGVIDRLAKLPKENRRSYALEVVRRADFLLERTSYSPFEFLVDVAPSELTTQLWDALVQSLIDEVNRGGEVTDQLLIRAEALRPLPAETRLAYTSRILGECHEPEAALRYGALLSSLDSAAPPPVTTAAALSAAPALPSLPAPQTPRALPAPPAPAALAPPRKVAALPPGPQAPRALAPPAPSASSLLPAPVALRGERLGDPSRLVARALLLLSGLSLLRDLGLGLARLSGFRRRTDVMLAGGELVIDETTSWLGRVLAHHRGRYAMPAITTLTREVPYQRLYLLLGLAGFTLALALAVPLFWTSTSAVGRTAPLYAACAVLLGIAVDLVGFMHAYLWRGSCALAVGLHGGDIYRLGAVSEASLAEFVKQLRARAVPEPATATQAAAQASAQASVAAQASAPSAAAPKPTSRSRRLES